MKLIVQFKSPENFTAMNAHDIFRKLQKYTPVKEIRMTAHVGGFVAYEITTSADSMTKRRGDALTRKLQSIASEVFQPVTMYGWEDATPKRKFAIYP